ncbi:MAG: helix-turn-helix transcriptional regulator [Clostridia bacterium]|nr:helix-turn-helix transcriptional regulator [Clostridia bacterium]
MKLNYIKHRITNLININKIVTIHFYEHSKNYSYEGESHNFWEMLYVDSGHAYIEANDKPIHLKQGEIIFHKPNEFHTIRTDINSSVRVFIISFVCSSKSMNFFKGKTCTVPPDLKKLLFNIIDEYTNTFIPMEVYDTKLELKDNPPIGGQQLIRTYLEQFLIMLIRADKAGGNANVFLSKESLENHLYAQIIEMIDNNIYKRITVEQICRELNYSRTYLSNIFKASSGYTILEYILIRKIQESKKLIAEKKYNFTHISDMLSFDNSHYFSRVFKRISGMTPTEYKNSLKD